MFNPYDPDKEMTSLNGIVSIPKQGMLTCNQLAVMGRVAEEREDWCVLIRPFVQTPCGCQSTVPTAAPTKSSQPPVSEDTALGIQGSSAYDMRNVAAVLLVVALNSAWQVTF